MSKVKKVKTMEEAIGKLHKYAQAPIPPKWVSPKMYEPTAQTVEERMAEMGRELQRLAFEMLTAIDGVRRDLFEIQLQLSSKAKGIGEK